MSFDRDLRAKEKAKYDDRFKEMEEEAQEWIEEIIGHPIPPPHSSTNSSVSSLDLCEGLKDGTVLCELVNIISPKAIRYKKSTMPFIQMENIAAFLTFSRETLGIPDHDLFQTIDLFERKNIFQVIQAIHTFSRYCATYLKTQQGRDVRFLGPKMSVSVSREFSKEQLNEAKNHVNTYQYGRTNGSTNVLRGSRRDPAGNFH